MYIIGRTFSFSASHQLPHVPEDHPCERLHGHNYTVEVILKGEHLDEQGFVLDFHEMDNFRYYIKERLAHRHLNHIIPNPTTEHLAEHLFRVARRYYGPKLVSVRVKGTDTTFAEYRPTPYGIAGE